MVLTDFLSPSESLASCSLNDEFLWNWDFLFWIVCLRSRMFWIMEALDCFCVSSNRWAKDGGSCFYFKALGVVFVLSEVSRVLWGLWLMSFVWTCGLELFKGSNFAKSWFCSLLGPGEWGTVNYLCADADLLDSDISTSISDSSLSDSLLRTSVLCLLSFMQSVISFLFFVYYIS